MPCRRPPPPKGDLGSKSSSNDRGSIEADEYPMEQPRRPHGGIRDNILYLSYSGVRSKDLFPGLVPIIKSLRGRPLYQPRIWALLPRIRVVSKHKAN
ncbi:hypothetical protein Agabi119p4_6873 [Agaricus bisporus var. burnettii]|uniref:Uncharacterized protein n=1 Tax=Agaricus bisporus var. burnettii TaxID=192524 RepID=A0A8H7KF85_AGABI|nr:hypothetical protein Agabi119p4_6873 [Agaricus bisporus var. burnettii]